MKQTLRVLLFYFGADCTDVIDDSGFIARVDDGNDVRVFRDVFHDALRGHFTETGWFHYG